MGIFFISGTFLDLKDRATKKVYTEGDLPSAGSFPKRAQLLGLGEAKVRNPQDHLDLPCGWQGHKSLTVLCSFPTDGNLSSPCILCTLVKEVYTAETIWWNLSASISSLTLTATTLTSSWLKVLKKMPKKFFIGFQVLWFIMGNITVNKISLCLYENTVSIEGDYTIYHTGDRRANRSEQREW